MKRRHAGFVAALAATSALACAHGGKSGAVDPDDPPMESVLEKARAQSKPVVVFFHAEW